MLCDSLIAVLVALLFGSFGLSIATRAILAERPRRWFEPIVLLLSIFGGVVLAGIGLVGSWTFFKTVLGS
jgi:hypothetical protein